MRFRWTTATARTAFLGFIGVPLAVYYIADKYHVCDSLDSESVLLITAQTRWDWVGKRRGQLIESTTV